MIVRIQACVESAIVNNARLVHSPPDYTCRAMHFVEDCRTMEAQDMNTAQQSTTADDPAPMGSQPLIHQHGAEIQRFGTARLFPIGLAYEARVQSCQVLNKILADSMILYSLYKKHHWLVRGHTFYQLHLLLDKHAAEQVELIDLIAERVQTLGGIAIADPRHVAEVTSIPRPPDGAEEVPAMLSAPAGGARDHHHRDPGRDHGHGDEPRRRQQ